MEMFIRREIGLVVYVYPLSSTCSLSSLFTFGKPDRADEASNELS